MPFESLFPLQLLEGTWHHEWKKNLFVAGSRISLVQPCLGDVCVMFPKGLRAQRHIEVAHTGISSCPKEPQHGPESRA